MPEEIVAIIIIAIVAGTITGVIKQILQYKRDTKLQQGGVANAQGGVTTSELKGLLREAVEEATAPLVDEVERLREQMARLERPALPEAEMTRLLDADDVEPPSTEAVRASRRRTS